jgi:integrase
MRDQGQGHIRQRGQQRWELKFDLGRDPASGKRISRFVTFQGTKREAQAELNRLLNRRNEGTYVDPTKMSVAEYLEHWLAVDIERRVANKTATRHRGIVRHNINPRIGAIPLRKLTAVHIEALEAELQREGRHRHRDARGPALTAQTVLHVHRTLSQALEHAVKTDVLFRNPALQVRPPRPPGREIKILTKPEIAQVLRASEGRGLYLPVLVAVTTGIRRGELFGLRWSNLDLAKGRLSVNQSLEWTKGKPAFKAPKTKGSRRTITLPGLTVQALAAHKVEQAEERLRLGLGKPELVFTRADGEPVSLDYVSRTFGELIAKLGVTPITFHGLRHTHISHQLMDGVHLKVVSERAGHASVSITLSVYATFLPSLQDKAAEGVDAWLRDELANEVGGKSVAITPFPKTKPQPSD